MNFLTIAGGGYEAAFDPENGANPVSLRHIPTGAKLFREPDYEKGDRDSFVFGSPVLFPVNRISGGRFTFDGREYVLPVNEPKTGCHLHGTLAHMPFCVTMRSRSRVVFEAAFDEKKPYLTFPHAFALRLDCSLDENGFTRVTTVENRSGKRMPVMLGFHTAFAIPFAPDGGRVTVRMPAAEAFERDENYLPSGRTLSDDGLTEALRAGTFAAGEPFSRLYRAAGRRTTLTDETANLTLTADYDESYVCRMVYGGGGFLCVEPQTCLTNCVNVDYGNVPDGFLSLEPGEARSFAELYAVALTAK